MERDVQLDCYRSLTMMYIVCIIHPMLWFHLDVFGFYPTMLLEMPVIFFIAGASQKYTRQRTIIETLKNRSLRVLFPYYICLCNILILMIVATFLHLSFENELIDIRKIGLVGIIKLLLTGGSQHIPYLGYTWFISTYMIISCSLPFQKWVMHKLQTKWYILILLIFFGLWKSTGITSPECIIENIMSYNIFFILGYLTYKKIKTNYLVVILTAILCIYLILSGIAVPIGKHKFPSDIVFVVYNTLTLYILAFVISKINIKYNTITRLWNERGYTIYLYQSVTHFIVYKIICETQIFTNNGILLFIISTIMVFILATALSYITILPEKFILNKLLKR